MGEKGPDSQPPSGDPSSSPWACYDPNGLGCLPLQDIKERNTQVETSAVRERNRAAGTAAHSRRKACLLSPQPAQEGDENRRLLGRSKHGQVRAPENSTLIE